MIGNILNKVLLICLSLICLKGQDQLDIKNAEYMPFHTKILWGENHKTTYCAS